MTALVLCVDPDCLLCCSDSNWVPSSVATVVLSVQHTALIGLDDLRHQVLEKAIKAVIPAKYLTATTKYHINPCGLFVIGGPCGDAGLTGRP